MNKKLAAIRRYHNVSQKEMAAELGISERSYSDKELGKYQFKANEMYAISKKFNMTIEDIFFDENFEKHEVLPILTKGAV